MIDCLKTIFRKREDKKRLYLLSMMVLIVTHMMATQAEQYCQFLFTKRQFQWEMDTYSYYTTMDTIAASLGLMLFTPLFHHFNVHDNIILLISSVSLISAQMIRAFAQNEAVFFGSVAADFGSSMFMAPIRAQMTRCIPIEENGKVFAMLASLECLVPILGSAIFTNLYNATSQLDYPWVGSFYFGSSAIVLLGIFLGI